MFILEGSLAADKSDELMSEKAFHSSTKLLHHGILARSDSLEVEAVRKVRHTEFRCVLEAFDNFGVLAECLRWDASLVKTSASNVS